MAEKQTPKQTLILLGAATALLVPVIVAALLIFRTGEAQVTGKVTLEGKPLPEAQVVFVGEDPTNPAPVVGETNDEGVYKLIGNKGRGIPVGKYKVVVNKMALKDGTIPKGQLLVQA